MLVASRADRLATSWTTPLGIRPDAAGARAALGDDAGRLVSVVSTSSPSTTTNAPLASPWSCSPTDWPGRPAEQPDLVGRRGQQAQAGPLVGVVGDVAAPQRLGGGEAGDDVGEQRHVEASTGASDGARRGQARWCGHARSPGSGEGERRRRDGRARWRAIVHKTRLVQSTISSSGTNGGDVDVRTPLRRSRRDHRGPLRPRRRRVGVGRRRAGRRRLAAARRRRARRRLLVRRRRPGRRRSERRRRRRPVRLPRPGRRGGVAGRRAGRAARRVGPDAPLLRALRDADRAGAGRAGDALPGVRAVGVPPPRPGDDHARHPRRRRPRPGGAAGPRRAVEGADVLLPGRVRRARRVARGRRRPRGPRGGRPRRSATCATAAASRGRSRTA